MEKLLAWVIFLELAIIFSFSAAAQDFSSLAPTLPHIFTVIKKLCGDQPAFSAQASLEVTTTDTTNSMMMPSKFSFYGNDMRWDVDAGQMTGDMTPEAAAALRAASLDQICFITRLDKKTSYVIFPGVREYLNIPIPEDEISNALATARSIKLNTEILGKETMDGHACTKTRLTVPEEAELHEEVIVWAANDLKNYPIRIDIMTPNGNLLFHFRDIKLVIPPVGTFEVDTNFSLKADAQEIMASAKDKERNEKPKLASPDAKVQGRIFQSGLATPAKGHQGRCAGRPDGQIHI